MGKITRGDIDSFFGERERLSQFEVKVKYRREGLTEKKYAIDTSSRSLYSKTKKLNHNLVNPASR